MMHMAVDPDPAFVAIAGDDAAVLHAVLAHQVFARGEFFPGERVLGGWGGGTVLGRRGNAGSVASGAARNDMDAIAVEARNSPSRSRRRDDRRGPSVASVRRGGVTPSGKRIPRGRNCRIGGRAPSRSSTHQIMQRECRPTSIRQRHHLRFPIRQMIGEEVRRQRAAAIGIGFEDRLQVRQVRRDPQDDELGQRASHAQPGFVAIASHGDHFGEHRIVVDRDLDDRRAERRRRARPVHLDGECAAPCPLPGRKPRAGSSA